MSCKVPAAFAVVFSALLVLAIGVRPVIADWNSEYQFGAEIPAPANDPLIYTKTTAFLWVPPAARHIRAVLIAPANVLERRVCDDPIIRAEAARDGMAIVFLQAGWKGPIADSPEQITFVQTVLDTLADRSGYDELRTAPWVPFGHSGNSRFCASLARQQPGRTLANIVVKGALPTTSTDGGAAGITGIPILFITGEFEEVMPPGNVRNAWWGVSMQRFAADRAAVPQALIGGLLDRSHGHLNWSDDLSRYVALFLHKAVAARLDAGGAVRGVAFDSGWLSDPAGENAAAPVKLYRGDPKKAFWNFDGEQAAAWTALFNRDKGKKEQMLAFTQDGAIAPWWPGWGVQQIEFRPLADGCSFKVSAVFRDAVPSPFADAGTPLGHAASGAVSYQVLGWAGATEQTGPDTFRVRFDREGVNGRTTHILIGASHPGDAQYRATVASAHFFVPGTNSEGARQALTFPEIADARAGSVSSIPLQGRADSGMPVAYYVAWGPAVVDGDRLRLTPIPAAAKFPVEVKVVAYQWGKATDPKVASAIPVTRVFHITR